MSLVAFQMQMKNRSVLATQFPKSHLGLGVHSLSFEQETSTGVAANFSREFANFKREFANSKQKFAEFK